MKKECDAVLHALSRCGLLVALLSSSPAVLAQGAAPAGPAAVPLTANVQAPAVAEPSVDAPSPHEEEHGYAPLQVGDATQGLLAWQRSGDIASKTPRPIAGSIAQRSYERYLKSFEFPIPERFNSSVKSGSASNGTGGGR